MNLWAEFWRAWLIVSGLSFAAITLIVAFKGLADLRTMFRDLSTDKGAASHGQSQQ
jgi:hypothetical protein